MNINKTGYLKNSRTKGNPYNIIPSGHITTEGMQFPIFANGKLLFPDTGDYKFDSDTVLETPAFYKGGTTMKKLKIKNKGEKPKMQAGGSIIDTGLNSTNAMSLLPPAANLGTTLSAPRGKYAGLNAPDINLANVGNSALAGGKLGMEIGGPYGAAFGAVFAGEADMAKELVDFNRNKKDWTRNLKDDRAEEKVDYAKTHKPYGTRGYMQGTPNEQVYSLFEGGMPTKKERINTQTAITDSYVSHGDVSLSKQDGGKIPDDLNELFDRAMEESGGDEEKAQQLIQQYQEHPEMVQNKGKQKHQLKKKVHA